MITMEVPSAFVSALASARDVALTAYTLRAGPVQDGLVAAARRGAAVRVRLERDPLDDGAGSLHAANRAAVAALRAAGADAALTAPGEPVLHLKAAVTDRTAWLTDRNWTTDGPSVVLRDDDADDVAVVRRAVAGAPAADRHLATTKAGAQRLEADVIARAGDAPLAVESESFGAGAVYNALLHRAEAGRAVRLLVAGREASQPENARERARLARLAALGAQVRLGDSARGDLDEKLAVGGDVAWVGSANATYARGDLGRQRDWGMTTRAPRLVDGLRAQFEQNWRAAVPYAPLKTSASP